MKHLFLVHGDGLTAEQACRGDQAAHLSDLIAEGSFAALAGTLDVAAAAGALPGDRVTVVPLPFRDIASFDAGVGDVRARSEGQGGTVAVLSGQVFISQHFFREIKVGRPLAVAEVPGLLASLVA